MEFSKKQKMEISKKSKGGILQERKIWNSPRKQKGGILQESVRWDSPRKQKAEFF
jgi:hypothetical protein